ncbi:MULTISPECIES: hypothetical protein [unclassified Mesobacillus]|uniref:hypothetical protein n=1 Tax=unclassified Mesobacillus TaxID=2675270 RepID=UPI00203E94BE|nr:MULTISPECIES: hypothetical protein [unclassified Mesobacillus]MCM3126022.1 hypothetical protein [Mesobacillus sp. MER 33]MCM3236008.1 hypothetical protein [Mesobacillus sp. MER 48]
MAKAIRQISRQATNETEERAQALEEIMQALADNKEAVLSMIEMAKELHEVKVFETAGSLLKQRNEVGVIAMQQVNQPAVHNVIKSGFGLFKFLGGLQPAQLETLMNGVTLGLKRMSQTGEKGKKQSIWKMRIRLRSPAIRAAMTTMVDFMEGMGEAFLRSREKRE